MPCKFHSLILIHFIFASLRGRCYYLAPFANMETKVQRGDEMCPRSHSSLVKGWD